MLKYLEAASVSPDRAVQHYLAAACVPREAVARLGDEALRKRCCTTTSAVCHVHQRRAATCPMRERLFMPAQDRCICQPSALNLRRASRTGRLATGGHWEFAECHACPSAQCIISPHAMCSKAARRATTCTPLRCLHLHACSGGLRCSAQLSRCRCGLDSPKPAVDLEEQGLVGALSRLFLGSSPEATALPPDSRVTPAGPALRARILALMCKSKAAADNFPHTLQVLVHRCCIGLLYPAKSSQHAA